MRNQNGLTEKRNKRMSTSSAASPSTGKGRRKPKLHILLVDDDPLFCHLMENRGAKLDIAVTTCASLEEIEVLALPDVFDVAVIDYYLDGVEKELRGSTIARLLRTTPTILVSRNGECVEDNEVWPHSIRKFLTKDVGPSGILETALKLKRIDQ